MLVVSLTIVGIRTKQLFFYHSDEQKDSAETSRAQLEESGPFEGKVITPIVPAKVFYDAEEEHQDYHLKKTHFTINCIKEAQVEQDLLRNTGGMSNE